MLIAAVDDRHVFAFTRRPILSGKVYWIVPSSGGAFAFHFDNVQTTPARRTKYPRTTVLDQVEVSGEFEHRSLNHLIS